MRQRPSRGRAVHTRNAVEVLIYPNQWGIMIPMENFKIARLRFALWICYRVLHVPVDVKPGYII